MTTLVLLPSLRDGALVPEWVIDLPSFRRWATSDDFPQSGRFSHLDGQLCIDPAMERITHNQIKVAITATLHRLLEKSDSGRFMADRMLLTHLDAGLSTEPDGMYISMASRDKKRVRFKNGRGSVEVLGSPDMVLEIVSASSEHKDRVTLRDLYHRAAIPEYWLVEELEDRVQLDILSWDKRGYVSSRPIAGWSRSIVFGRRFRIVSTSNDPDLARFRLQIGRRN